MSAEWAVPVEDDMGERIIRGVEAEGRDHAASKVEDRGETVTRTPYPDPDEGHTTFEDFVDDAVSEADPVLDELDEIEVDAQELVDELEGMEEDDEEGLKGPNTQIARVDEMQSVSPREFDDELESAITRSGE